MDKFELWLRLMMVPRLGAVKLAGLCVALEDCALEESGTVVAERKLLELGLSAQQCQSFGAADKTRLHSARCWLEKSENHLISVSQPIYPAPLRALSDPPAFLFVQGNPEVLSTPQLAMVGSRRYTPYGERWGSYFAAKLAAIGVTVTSGMAYGIDAICHRATLNAQGKTVAVLGNGLQDPYPRHHHRLAQEIVSSSGALVSEYLPDTKPFPANFPQRNRIISGLSMGVFVVEASQRSGSLITARHALEQGREVFALPGPIDETNSQGCNHLIRQGAWLVSQLKDLLEQLESSLKWLSLPNLATESPLNTGRGLASESSLPEFLLHIGMEPTAVNTIVDRSGKPLSEVAAKLVELELDGWIKSVPGGYVRQVRGDHV